MRNRINTTIADRGPARPYVERPRPERFNNAHPPLISSIWGKVASEREFEDIRQHALAPAVGIAVSVILSGLIWGTIGGFIWAVVLSRQ
jgi:hypothetical protein